MRRLNLPAGASAAADASAMYPRNSRGGLYAARFLSRRAQACILVCPHVSVGQTFLSVSSRASGGISGSIMKYEGYEGVKGEGVSPGIQALPMKVKG